MADESQTTAKRWRVVPSSKREQRSYAAGRDACRAGKLETDNPEPRWTIWRDAWWDGWNDEENVRNGS